MSDKSKLLNQLRLDRREQIKEKSPKRRLWWTAIGGLAAGAISFYFATAMNGGKGLAHLAAIGIFYANKK